MDKGIIFRRTARTNKDEKSSKKPDEKEELRAGVSREEEKIVRKEAKEDQDEKVGYRTPNYSDVVVEELPDDAVIVEEAPDALDVNTVAGRTTTQSFAHPIQDDHTGKAGVFVIGKDGQRKQKYEEVKGPRGKRLGFRPVR